MAETPPEPLSADDAAILALESEAIAGHTLKLVVLEPGAEPLELERLRASVAGAPRGRAAGTPAGRARRREPPRPRAGSRTDDFDIARSRARARRQRGPRRGRPVASSPASSCPSASTTLGRSGRSTSLGPLADGREAIVAPDPSRDGRRDQLRALPRRACSGTGPRARLRPRVRQRRRRSGRAGAIALAEARRLPGALGRELGGHAARSPLDRPIGSARELAFATRRRSAS